MINWVMHSPDCDKPLSYITSYCFCVQRNGSKPRSSLWQSSTYHEH